MKYRTIIVDDEQPALSKLTYMLNKYDAFEIVGSFTNANEALAATSSLSPQVAFLDIAMPGLSGVELANHLQEISKTPIQIVFVTAYDQYAVTAFDINAIDYLMKPVSKVRFEKTILRILSSLNHLTENNQNSIAPTITNTTPIIRTFGKLEIDNISEKKPEWRTAKVRELFALFLTNRSEGIFKKTLLHTLWSDLPEDKALQNLNTCNYYLRTFIKETHTDITLNYKSGYYFLDLGTTLCDMDLFLEAESLSQNITTDNLDTILFATSLYRGNYFEDVKCTWANLLRDQYKIRYVHIRVALASYFIKNKDYDHAIHQATFALDIDSLYEDAWMIILNSYSQLNDTTHYESTLANRITAYNNKNLIVPSINI